MNIWLTMLAAGVFTYATRLSFIMILGQREVSPRLQQALRFVPPAVLSALIFPDLLFPNGTLDPTLGNERLIAGILATAVAWRTKNVIATIVAGMATLLLLQAIF
jgi:branched-subunit amino acid transport protein